MPFGNYQTWSTIKEIPYLFTNFFTFLDLGIAKPDVQHRGIAAASDLVLEIATLNARTEVAAGNALLNRLRLKFREIMTRKKQVNYLFKAKSEDARNPDNMFKLDKIKLDYFKYVYRESLKS